MQLPANLSIGLAVENGQANLLLSASKGEEGLFSDHTAPGSRPTLALLLGGVAVCSASQVATDRIHDRPPKRPIEVARLAVF